MTHNPFYGLFRKLEARRRRRWDRVPAPLRRLFYRERTFADYAAKFQPRHMRGLPVGFRITPKERKSGKAR